MVILIIRTDQLLQEFDIKSNLKVTRENLGNRGQRRI